MSKIFEVRSIAKSDGKLHDWGAFRTRAEAEARLAKRSTGDSAEWARKHHERWWIEEIDTTGLFELPSTPPPRELFSIRTREIESGDGTWNTLRVDVLNGDGQTIAAYDRNYPAMYQTFEPFRQGDRMFALISSSYTATAVLDLATGEVVAAEESRASGFCPVGFYVPDWWDVNDGSMLPGSKHWDSDKELPKGDFGFVWGCVWGDDNSWKIQYLDLSQVKDGKIRREERFGYLKLAIHEKLEARDFIHCSFDRGECMVRLSTESWFDLATGKKLDEDM